jgi:fermentation-respiration switch protein FrsA (DUF1100 family)
VAAAAARDRHDVAAAQPLLTPEELRRARLPILLVYGDRDVFVPADHAVAIYRQLPDARLLIAPDSPHQVMVSQPALFNQAAATSTVRPSRSLATGPRLVLRSAVVPRVQPSGAPHRAPSRRCCDPFSNW